MNVKIAVKECLLKMVASGQWAGDKDSISKAHCVDMCNKIISGEISGEKSHRWLGWIQACICMNGTATLDELKLINKNSRTR